MSWAHVTELLGEGSLQTTGLWDTQRERRKMRFHGKQQAKKKRQPTCNQGKSQRRGHTKRIREISEIAFHWKTLFIEVILKKKLPAYVIGLAGWMLVIVLIWLQLYGAWMILPCWENRGGCGIWDFTEWVSPCFLNPELGLCPDPLLLGFWGHFVNLTWPYSGECELSPLEHGGLCYWWRRLWHHVTCIQCLPGARHGTRGFKFMHQLVPVQLCAW